MAYPAFDRSQLRLRALAERQHDVGLCQLLDPKSDVAPLDHPDLDRVAERVVSAHRQGYQVVLMMGAHVVKCGLSRYVIDLMERGVITHVAGNGACAIHDYELALIGATSESVARYIRTGEFGLWRETGGLNDLAVEGAQDAIGLGEAIGRGIEEGEFPHKAVSILAAGYRLRVPVTLHVGIGYDIIHEHPSCDGAALGRTSYQDFLVLAHTIGQLEGGVLMNYGTAVMGPEVYLKALSMARNVAVNHGRRIARFTTAVFDLIDLGEQTHEEAPRTSPQYYYRPYKTILVRTVRDGGESFYIRGDHRLTLPNLYKRIVREL